MKNANVFIFLGLISLIVLSCNQHSGQNSGPEKKEWRSEFNEQLALFGHRNWILIVDKAFPAQNAQGINIIDTGEELPDVLSFVLQQIENSTHVKPIVYTDKELNFITQNLAENIDVYKSSINKIIARFHPRTLLHDSVFIKIDEASKLFEVMVLKTDEVIAYSSIFIELDCRYWSSENEKALREAMKE